jgi:hypothetical protein
MHLVIGAGGVSSWLVPLLKKTLSYQEQIMVVDGDRLEERNLDRQLFGPEYLGWNKAEALAELYGCLYTPVFVDERYLEDKKYNLIWCCADNHPARKLTLEAVDQEIALAAIIGGNEFTDSEAYAYYPMWKGTQFDPRIFFPEINSDSEDNPLDPPSCQGVAQVQNRQLALANFIAAGFMVHLYWFLKNHGHEVSMDNWPKMHRSNFSMFTTRSL